MAKFLTETDFKVMAWKNGGGVTKELYRFPHDEDENLFYFRLSMAKIKASGPFSLFPNIDRTLLLLNGNGFKLHSPNSSIVLLDKSFSPISFKGEEPIRCELLDGECQDFNVMIDRRWGKTRVNCRLPGASEKIVYQSQNQILLYIHQQNPQLIILSAGESYEFKATQEQWLIEVEVIPSNDESEHIG